MLNPVRSTVVSLEGMSISSAGIFAIGCARSESRLVDEQRQPYALESSHTIPNVAGVNATNGFSFEGEHSFETAAAGAFATTLTQARIPNQHIARRERLGLQ
jgi:hypothetical protein